MSPTERKFPRLHDRRAALLTENNRLRDAIHNGDWRNGGNELASMQATITDNSQELDELEQVLADKVPLTINLILMGILVIILIAFVVLRM